MKLAKFTIYLIIFLISKQFIIKSTDVPVDLIVDKFVDTPILADTLPVADRCSNLDKKPIVAEKPSLEIFYSLLEKYKPSAPWIIQELMELSLSEFQEAFEYIIEILTQPQKRWYYFTDKKENFDQNEYWMQCLWQCNYYDQWLRKNAFIVKDKLVFKNEIDRSLTFYKKVMSVKEYLQFLEFKALYQFYAFYIDCLSHFFCFAVQNAYLYIEDANAYKLYISIARKSFKKIVVLLSEIKSSRFFNNYKFAIEKYKGILAILSNEILLKKIKKI